MNLMHEKRDSVENKMIPTNRRRDAIGIKTRVSTKEQRVEPTLNSDLLGMCRDKIMVNGAVPKCADLLAA